MSVEENKAAVLTFLAQETLGWKWTHYITQETRLTEPETVMALATLEREGLVERRLFSSPGRRVAPIIDKPGWKATEAGLAR